MEGKFGIVTIANAVCVAAYAAIALGYAAHYALGLSRAEIRGGASIVAMLIAALLAVDFFGNRPGNAK